ncbi:hypothetical protein [Urbifossiella limnaea]|nr:hypothetical protein [Urbifossiella limnaea]
MPRRPAPPLVDARPGRLSWELVYGDPREYKVTVRLANGLAEEIPLVVR